MVFLLSDSVCLVKQYTPNLKQIYHFVPTFHTSDHPKVWAVAPSSSRNTVRLTFSKTNIITGAKADYILKQKEVGRTPHSTKTFCRL